MYAPCSPWPSWPTPFPYTTLFRSLAVHFDKREEAEAVVRQLPDGLLRRPEISQVRRAAGGGLRSTPAARRAVAPQQARNLRRGQRAPPWLSGTFVFRLPHAYENAVRISDRKSVV